MSTPQSEAPERRLEEEVEAEEGLLEPEVLVEEVAAQVENQVGREETEGDLEEDVDQAPGPAGDAVLDRPADVGLERLVSLHRHGRQLLAGEVAARRHRGVAGAGSSIWASARWPRRTVRARARSASVSPRSASAAQAVAAWRSRHFSPASWLRARPPARRAWVGVLARSRINERIRVPPADQSPRSPASGPAPQAWVNWRRIRDRQSRRLVSMRSVIRERILARSVDAVLVHRLLQAADGLEPGGDRRLDRGEQPLVEPQQVGPPDAVPRPAGQLMLEQVAEPAELAIGGLAVLLVGQRLHRIEPEDFRDPQAQGVEVLPQVGPVVGIVRGVGLDVEDLPPRRVLEQLLPDHVRLVLLRGDGVDHHVAVGKDGAEDVEVALAAGTIVGVLGVGVRAVHQDHLPEQGDVQAMDLDRVGIEAEERGIDVGVAGHDRAPGHGPVFLAGPADRPAEQGVEERALARPRPAQEADHERPVQVDLGDAEPGLEPADEALGRGERGPGGAVRAHSTSRAWNRSNPASRCSRSQSGAVNRSAKGMPLSRRLTGSGIRPGPGPRDHRRSPAATRPGRRARGTGRRRSAPRRR